jgi:hypothetical protein
LREDSHGGSNDLKRARPAPRPTALIIATLPSDGGQGSGPASHETEPSPRREPRSIGAGVNHDRAPGQGQRRQGDAYPFM